MPDGVFIANEMSADPRVQVFRRRLTNLEEFGSLEVDSYVVATRRFLIVLDTLLCPEDMAEVLSQVRGQLDASDLPLLVVNSHADWDHAWGNSYFTGAHAAPLIAHDHTFAQLHSMEAQEELEHFKQRSSVFEHVVLTPPTITFSNTLTFHGDDLTIKLFHAPGHKSEHIAAWLPELSLLFAFDACEYPIPSIENSAGVPHMFTTLEYFLELQPRHVLCSHGKTTSIAVVERNLAYLRDIERRSQQFLKDHWPTTAELDKAADLIRFPFEEVVEGIKEPFDEAFYKEAHDRNSRFILEWALR